MKHILYLFFVLNIASAYNLKAQSILDIPVKNVDGNITTIESVAEGEILVLDFWATWCKPCVKSVPKLAELSEKFKDQGISFIGINEDSPRNLIKVKPMSKLLGFNYPVVLDTDQAIMSALLVSSFPTLVILNKNEKVLYTHEGFITGDEKEIEKEIVRILESEKSE